MRRLLFVQLGLLALSLVLGLCGWLRNDQELWLVGTAFAVAAVVMGVMLIIVSVVEKRVLFAVGGFLLGAAAFLTAYLELLVGAVTADPEGRPLRLSSKRGRGSSWARGPVPAVPVDQEKWLAAARAEHASVPAFARVAYQLWAHGAPPELIARAHRAALEEIDHARRCYAVAGIDEAEALPLPQLDAGTRGSIARESLLDGVYGEGKAAKRAAESAKRETDPVLRELHALIARDEAQHAELARDIVKWLRSA